MPELHTDIEIDAPADRVWAVLTDLPGYAKWNRFMPEASGTIAAGEQLKVRIDPPGGRGMTFTPRVTMCEPGRKFTWLGRLFIPGIFDGAHSFEVHSIAEARTRMVQSESFSGVLVPLMWRSMAAPTEAGFNQMNEDLKRFVESGGGL